MRLFGKNGETYASIFFNGDYDTHTAGSANKPDPADSLGGNERTKSNQTCGSVMPAGHLHL
jgi:hypothetical protein